MITRVVKRRRRWIGFTLAVCALILLFQQSEQATSKGDWLPHPNLLRKRFQWKNVRQQHPVEQFIQLPLGPVMGIPKIQYEFQPETADQKNLRRKRLSIIKESFIHSWDGYRNHAWRHDEVSPISGKASNAFGGWGATLVDSLDTLWIMGMKKEFEEAVWAVRRIDFSQSPLDKLSVFETTIRYLGGLLSAYDISGQKYPILLKKAVELGDMLYVAFDTPNRMPITRWDWKNGAMGGQQTAPRSSVLAEVGSLTLEFTRLSQLTGENRWFDAVTRVMNSFADQQNRTKVPGLWPVLLDTEHADFTHGTKFTFGALADSFYEYLPKQHLLLGNRGHQDYESMYLNVYAAAKERIFFRALNPQNQRMLFAGTFERRSALHSDLKLEGQHLTCFVGGMVALGAKTFEKPEHLKIARELVDGCVWAYKSMPKGIMPESFHVARCGDEDCTWSEQKWFNAVVKHYDKWSDNSDAENNVRAQKLLKRHHVPPGFTEINDARYLLRPEAIESVFILYRITGDETLRDNAWDMYTAIANATRTPIAYAGLKDVMSEGKPELLDTMESFWTAETLKYFYLIFSEPQVVSLDDYVL